jgi:hypothetical protein
MYVLIDCTNHQAIATHDSYIALSCLAYIQFANVDCSIFPTNENRPFAKFKQEHLDQISDGVLAKIDNVARTATYTDAIGRCREIINAAQHLRLPFGADFLAEQAECIKPDDDKPYFISTEPDAKRPTKVAKWAVLPNVNRPRYATPMAAELTRRAGVPAAPESSSKELPPPPGVPAPPKAPKAPRAPRAPVEGRDERNGVRRPGAGSKTAVVWEVADEMAAAKKNKLGDRKAFRTQVIVKCKEKGVNSSTASVQYALWDKFNAEVLDK